MIITFRSWDLKGRLNGRIPFDNPVLTQSVGVAARVLILFSGGPATDGRVIRPVIGAGVPVATISVSFTAVIVGVACVWLLDFSWVEGLLLGAIVSSTDAVALLRLPPSLPNGPVPVA